MTDKIANPNTEKGKTLRGLSLLEVKEREEKGLINSDAVTCTKTVSEIIKSNLLTPFHALNVLLAILVLLAGSLKNALFMGVVISNAAIGIFQELRAKKQVDKLAFLADSGANVLRDGAEQNIPKGEVVLDDILHLTLGSQVICDCEIVSGECEADESLLTGEADPVTRSLGDNLSSGSFIVSGDVYARVIHVGADNYASKLAADAGGYSKPKSEISKSINSIIRVMAIVMLPIGIALFCRQFFALDLKLEEATISTVAALVGMIPEGLVLLTSVVLAVGTIRLARKNALVQELYSIEMLARVDTLCLDKTGTLTEGRMRVERVISCSAGEKEVSAAAAIVAYGTGDKNPTADAIRSEYAEPQAKVCDKTPFSSIRKWSSVTTGEGTYTMGSGEHIFGADWADMPEAAKAKELAAEGYRVITVVKTPAGGKKQLLGFLLISDVVRESAADTLKYFASEGVDIKVISGDDPVTVSHIADKAGLSGAERYIDMSQVEDCDIAEVSHTYKVFGRVSPTQKAEIIKALQSEGHCVAMTGDGVNDVIALRQSDCGIAMQSGSDAARHVSRIVLLTSDFAVLPEIVAEGRRSINNLQRSASLFLVKTIFAALTALIFIFLRVGYPLDPIQFTLISTLTIGFPSFVLALQKNNERVRGQFLRKVLLTALPGALTDVLITLLLSTAAVRFAGAEATSTFVTIMLGYVGLLFLFKLCLPLTPLRIALFATSAGAFAIAVTVFHKFFEMTVLTGESVLVLLISICIATILFAALTYICNKTLRKYMNE